LFEGLSVDELESIAACCTQEMYAADDILCRAGEEGAHTYVLTSGQASVETVTASGEERQLALLNQGQIFGEFAFIHLGPRIVSIRATQPCTVLSVSCENVERIAQQEPHVGFIIMRNLSRRVCRRLRELDVSLLMTEEEEEESGGLLQWLGFGRSRPEPEDMSPQA